MSELTPNNPANNPKNNSGSNDNVNSDYELITAYIDNEISDPSEKERIKNLILTNNDFHNRYTFELNSKQLLSSRFKKIDTPVYLYKNVGEGIDAYIREASKASVDKSRMFTDQIDVQRSNLRRNLIWTSFAFVLLIGAAFLINSMFLSTPEISENDLVAVSRRSFDNVTSGKVKPQFQSADANALEDSMDKYVDFEVFVPQVANAVLIGGVCNEINGQKVAHFMHKKGNVIIYTLQAELDDIMTNKDKIILCDEYKKNIKDGKNWFSCNKEKNKTTVMWVHDKVVCSSVADMDSSDIIQTLSNYTNK